MAKVRTNKQHDYITLRVEWSKESRVNMTWSRYGEKVTFIGMTDAHARLLMREMKLPRAYKTNGEWIDAVAKAAENTLDASTLYEAMIKTREAKTASLVGAAG
jgi:hypothetical protein